MNVKRFFELAGTAPAAPFEAGDTALIVMLGKEPFFTVLTENGSFLSSTHNGVTFPIQDTGRSIGGAVSRIAFTVEEAREMGYEPPIPDKAPVICWGGEAVLRRVSFYDAKHNRAFGAWGNRSGDKWQNYRQLSDSEARAIWGPDYDEIVSKLED